jgi:hypothetical protein
VKTQKDGVGGRRAAALPKLIAADFSLLAVIKFALLSDLQNIQG